MQHFTHFTNYEACVRFLTSELHKSAPSALKDKAGFEKSQEILRSLGNPQDSTPSVHIAATSGKGSMAYGIDAILRAHAMRTTLMVSPHAYDIRERIQQDARLIPKQSFMQLAQEVLSSTSRNTIVPTYFEVLMSMGFLAAAKQHGDYIVVETGLGGLWDTSNTITRNDKIAVVGSIGLDHVHILGNTLEKIAAQKAGIMPYGGQAVVLKQSDSVNAVFETVAIERGTTLHWVEPASTEYETNWKMAQATARLIAQRDNWEYNETLAQNAINRLTIPARFETRNVHGQTIVLDAAHNPQKAAALTTWLQQKFPNQAFKTLIAISDGKDAANIIRALNPITLEYVVTEFLTNEQDLPVHAVPADTLASIISDHCGNIPISIHHDATEALNYTASAPDQPVLIAGSFYLVGELGKGIPA